MPELVIRSLLHRAGYRFRINDNRLPGTPDIVLPKYKIAIFVHGCFWHRHNKCSKATTPSTNREFWIKKFNRNITNDIEIRKKLKKLLWHVIVLWECKILNDPVAVLDSVIRKLSNDKSKKYPIKMDRREIMKIAEKRSRYYLGK